MSRSKHSGSGGEDLLALFTQLALRSDVPVERHRPDAEFSAQFGHRRVAVGHRGLSQPHLGFRQRELPAALAAAGPCGLEPSHGAFADQLPLELGQRCEDAEHEAAGRERGDDLRALAGKHPQAHAAGGQVRSCTVLTRWARLRPRRSSFQTTSTSPVRRARRQLSSPGRSSRTPEAKSW